MQVSVDQDIIGSMDSLTEETKMLINAGKDRLGQLNEVEQAQRQAEQEQAKSNAEQLLGLATSSERESASILAGLMPLINVQPKILKAQEYEITAPKVNPSTQNDRDWMIALDINEYIDTSPDSHSQRFEIYGNTLTYNVRYNKFIYGVLGYINRFFPSFSDQYKYAIETDIDMRLKTLREDSQNRLIHTYTKGTYIASSDGQEKKQTVFFSGSIYIGQLAGDNIKNKNKFNDIFNIKYLPEDMIIFNKGKLLVSTDGQQLPFQWDNEKGEWEESQDELFYEKIEEDIIEKTSLDNFELKSIDLYKAVVDSNLNTPAALYQVVLKNTNNTELTALITGDDDKELIYNIRDFLTLYNSSERRNKLSTLVGINNGSDLGGIVNQANFKGNMQRMSQILTNNQYSYYQMALAKKSNVHGIDYHAMDNDLLTKIKEMNTTTVEEQLDQLNPTRTTPEQFRIFVQLENDENAINESIYNRYARYPDSSIIVQMGLDGFEIVTGTKNLNTFLTLKELNKRGVLLEFVGHGNQFIFGLRYADSLAQSLNTMLTQLPQKMADSYNSPSSEYEDGPPPNKHKKDTVSALDFAFSIEHINMGGCSLGKRASWFIGETRDVTKVANDFNKVTLTNTQDSKALFVSDNIDIEALKFAGLSYTEGLMFHLAKINAVNQKPVVFEAYSESTFTNRSTPLFEESPTIEMKNYHKVFVLDGNKLTQLEDADLAYEFYELDRTNGLTRKVDINSADRGVWKYTIKKNDSDWYQRLDEVYKNTNKPLKIFRGKEEKNRLSTELD